jgi:uncharacterized protein (UPF0333 family)
MKATNLLSTLFLASSAATAAAVSNVAATFDVPSYFTYDNVNGTTLAFNAEQLAYLQATISELTVSADNKISIESEALQKRVSYQCGACIVDCITSTMHGSTGFYSL